jgi:hypothetical protein
MRRFTMNCKREEKGRMPGEECVKEVEELLGRDVTIKGGGVYTNDLSGNHAVLSLDIFESFCDSVDEDPTILHSEEVHSDSYLEDGEYFESIFASYNNKKDLSACFVCRENIANSDNFIKYFCHVKSSSYYFHIHCFLDFMESLSIGGNSVKVTHNL